MRKLFLTGIVAISLVLVMPVIAQAEDNVKTVNTTAQAEISTDIEENTITTYTMYARCPGVNIRKEPNIESEILGQTLLNTSFDVVEDVDGWSKILGEDGFAYIKSEYLSDIPTEVPNYTDEDLYVLAHVICGEAQCYSNDEQRYVGSVVLNRVKSSDFPDTIKEVVFQKGQYACTWDGNYDREPTEANWENAKWLLENGSILPDNVVWQSGDKQGKGVYLKTRWHYYCY